MPTYRCPRGTTVTADEAMLNGRLRTGYASIMAPGESINFDVRLIDGARVAVADRVYLTDAAKGGAASIDEAFSAAVAESAKAAGLKPAEWLAQQSPQDIGRLVAAVAEQIVQAATGAGIVKAFNVDDAAHPSTRSLIDAAHRGGADLAQITADARAGYLASRNAREAQIDYRTRREPAPPSLATPVVTGDAAADYAAARDAAKARLDYRTR